MSGNRAMAILASVVVLAAVLAGIVLLGSPSEERLQRLDARRIADLQQLARALEARAERSGQLPSALAELVDGRLLDVLPLDPESGLDYGYTVTGARSYRLCAEFSAASRVSESPTFWSHPPGRGCFELATANQ